MPTEDRMRVRAETIQVDEAAGQLIVRWRDGRDSRYALVDLRRTCPCAACQERRRQRPVTPAGELVVVDSRGAAASTRAVRVDAVGHYGLRITWADGHDYGIYTFKALRNRDGAAP